jgi:hypothetical protein
MPPYWQDVVRRGQVPITAADYAKSRIKEMQSIFLGRVVSAEHVQGGAYIVTYEVSEWYKGKGRPLAKIIWYPAIPCENCRVEETIQALQADPTEAVVFADTLRNNVRFPTLMEDDLDGEDRPCRDPHSIRPTKELLPSRDDREYDDVVFRNALRVQLRTFPRTNPQKQH